MEWWGFTHGIGLSTPKIFWALVVTRKKYLVILPASYCLQHILRQARFREFSSHLKSVDPS